MISHILSQASQVSEDLRGKLHSDPQSECGFLTCSLSWVWTCVDTDVTGQVTRESASQTTWPGQPTYEDFFLYFYVLKILVVSFCNGSDGAQANL